MYSPWRPANCTTYSFPLSFYLQGNQSLFVALDAEVEVEKGSRVTITLNEEIAVFHRPHPRKETVRGAVKSVREFLKIAGVKQC